MISLIPIMSTHRLSIFLIALHLPTIYKILTSSFLSFFSASLCQAGRCFAPSDLIPIREWMSFLGFPALVKFRKRVIVLENTSFFCTCYMFSLFSMMLRDAISFIPDVRIILVLVLSFFYNVSDST
jgi:hypothetical protein